MARTPEQTAVMAMLMEAGYGRHQINAGIKWADKRWSTLDELGQLTLSHILYGHTQWNLGDLVAWELVDWSKYDITVEDMSDDLHPLYCQYDGQCTTQPAYVEIAPEARILSSDYSGDDGIPMDVWNERRLQIPVSNQLRNDEIDALLLELVPLAVRVCEGYADHWDGSNYVGCYSSDAITAWEAIKDICRQALPDDNGGIMDADDWLEDNEGYEYDITADSTDAELAAAETEIANDAELDGWTVTGIDTWLEDRRAEMQ